MNLPATPVPLPQALQTLRELNHLYGDLDRKVFRYDGTLDQFRAVLAQAGILVGHPGTGSQYGTYAQIPDLPGQPQLPGPLEVWQIGHSFYIGTPAAMHALLQPPWAPREPPPEPDRPRPFSDKA